VASDGTIVDLSALSGLVRHDPSTHRATIGTGTKIGDLTKLLYGVGQGLPNMGDIDKQTIGGALGTATHGSGQTLGAYHTQLTHIKMVDGKGDVREFSNETSREWIEATGVALGAFGIFTEVTMQNMASYRLHKKRDVTPIGDMLANFEHFMLGHRSAEFYFIPFSGHAMGLTCDLSDEPVTIRPPEADEDGIATLKMLRNWLTWFPWARRKLIGSALAKVPPEDYVQDWLNVYTSDRVQKFNEMEYHLPFEEGAKALKEIIDLSEKHFPEVYFPMEVRSVAPDNFWLSPFYKRLTCSIAVHHDAAENPVTFTRACEAIFRKYGGRPHWGKMHNLRAPDFAALYPRWNDAMTVRREIDPDERFISPYLKQVFGL
jgi:FAD-linked oxidoreductase